VVTFVSPVIYVRTAYYVSNTMSETADPRKTILDYVSENPGVHFNELVRSVEMATGQVQYHMYRLTKRGDIDGDSLYGRTHYYPAEYPEDRRGAVALLRRETAREVVVYIVENGETRPDELAEALDVARSTVEWHLGRLEEQSLVSKSRGDGGRVTVSAVDEDRTVEMLSDISPSLADTVVDRFVTMVDRMLEET
jgi:predicted transcriptional regulator